MDILSTATDRVKIVIILYAQIIINLKSVQESYVLLFTHCIVRADCIS